MGTILGYVTRTNLSVAGDSSPIDHNYPVYGTGYEVSRGGILYGESSERFDSFFFERKRERERNGIRVFFGRLTFPRFDEFSFDFLFKSWKNFIFFFPLC